jgi:hypothetical protein
MTVDANEAGRVNLEVTGVPDSWQATLLGGGTVVSAVLLDGAGFGATGYAHPTAAARPSALNGIGGPQLHLPAEAQDNREYLLWSTAGFPKMVNGKSSVTPRVFEQTVVRAESFPDAASVTYLRDLGVRSVVLHLRRIDGTPWEDWEQRPVAGLGVTREVRDGLVVYFIDAG